MTQQPSQQSLNSLALAAFILVLASIMFPPLVLPGVVCGHLARAQIRRGKGSGDGFALAALVTGWLFLGVFIVMMLLIGGLIWNADQLHMMWWHDMPSGGQML
ncbi:DUF4190 domain-containing protein [Terasakiispira papahanaumokuakeensis]|nr:DUF4190 domain-containing protein [Terasakiispira papahanaumokuakeensis]